MDAYLAKSKDMLTPESSLFADVGSSGAVAVLTQTASSLRIFVGGAADGREREIGYSSTSLCASRAGLTLGLVARIGVGGFLTGVPN